MVEQYPDLDWCWFWLINKDHRASHTQFVEERMKKYMAAYKIQQHWNKATFDFELSSGLASRSMDRSYDEMLAKLAALDVHEQNAKIECV